MTEKLSADDAEYAFERCDQLSERFRGTAIMLVFTETESLMITRMSAGEVMRALCTWIGSRLYEWADAQRRRDAGRPDYDA